jgi:uncharacterized protein (DUF2225 family)
MIFKFILQKSINFKKIAKQIKNSENFTLSILSPIELEKKYDNHILVYIMVKYVEITIFFSFLL